MSPLRSRRTSLSADRLGRAASGSCAACAVVLVVLACGLPSAQAQPAPATISSTIAQLSSLDYATRMNAARTLRRVPAAEAVPALTEAVRSHRDEFVRYRAFIVLSSFQDRGMAAVARGLLRDANDRLREVAFKWVAANPDPALVPALLSALQGEEAEFVRPAVVSALAAVDADARVQRALLADVGRGLDFFRGAVIDALGRRKAVYAVDAIAAVAKLQGPLQQDAVIALGRIGDARARQALSALAADAPSPAMALSIRAAQCIAGERCDTAVQGIVTAVSQESATAAVVRAGLSGLTAMAAAGNDASTAAIVTLGDRGGVIRDRAAIGLGTVAVMNARHLIDWFGSVVPATRDAAIVLLKDGFDDLEEDFGEEQFFATTRAAYWSAADGSSTRALASLLIQRLEF